MEWIPVLLRRPCFSLPLTVEYFSFLSVMSSITSLRIRSQETAELMDIML